jgi:hypothetical protein
MGQRDTIWMRISKRAHDAGFFEHGKSSAATTLISAK